MSGDEDDEFGREVVRDVLCPDGFFVDIDDFDFTVTESLGVNWVLLKVILNLLEVV